MKIAERVLLSLYEAKKRKSPIKRNKLNVDSETSLKNFIRDMGGLGSRYEKGTLKGKVLNGLVNTVYSEDDSTGEEISFDETNDWLLVSYRHRDVYHLAMFSEGVNYSYYTPKGSDTEIDLASIVKKVKAGDSVDKVAKDLNMKMF